MVMSVRPPKPVVLDGKPVSQCWRPAIPTPAQLHRMSMSDLIMLDRLGIVEATSEIRRRQVEQQQ